MRGFTDAAWFGGAMLLGMVALAASTEAQTVETAASQEFDVASVKIIPNSAGIHNTSFDLTHGRLTAEYAALRQLVGLAYSIQRVRVEGGPDWMDTDRYEILAKAASADASQDQIRAMLQKLLADRFKLVVHRSTKELTAYTLIPGKKGSKLQEVKEDERGAPATTWGTGKYGRAIIFRNMPLAGLVNTLANMLGSPVTDATGLNTLYNFTLDWSEGGPAASSNAVPSLFDAVEEELGLKLVAKKAPGDILVVDHAEKATEN
jgi:uncharacterized protein (TIGR03435 family)